MINNVRIAIRDSTDSHNVAFFDNVSGIRYQSANLQRFLAGSASILTIEYNSKDIDTIRTGCKLAFIYKEHAYWLNIMDLSKKGYKVEITAYSLGLELNQEERGAHKPANAMSFAEYLAYYDPEHALELGVNEVAGKRIKLEWTGTDTILARLFSIANSFDAELEFTVELNQDYSLKRQVLNIYKKGNLGSNRAASPIRVGRGLKVINYSDNLKELRTAVRATGKDGLTIDGLNKKVYDDDGNLLYYSSGMTVYAPQSRDKYPSVGKKSNDNWIIKELGETEYSTKEALWGYMLGELKKICVPEITYDIEGAVDGDVGDTRTLIDDVHYDPPLYVQGRISELTEDLITGKVTKSTLTNFERKYSQIADSLLKQVEALAEEAAPYIVRLSTDNGYNFKNGQGTSTITAKLEKYSKIVNAKWKWLINNSVVSETSSVKINASQVNGTLNVVAVAIVGGNEAAREYITFTNADDGVGIKSIMRYYTTNNQAEGVTVAGQNWSTKPTTVTTDKKYMWSYDVITYTNDTSLVTKPAVIGARGDDGLDADTTGITEALDKAKQELTALSANIEKVRNDSLEAAEEAKQQLTAVANDLSKAKTDLQNAVSAVDTKATNLQSDLSKAKQDLTSQTQQLQAQASAQSELTKRVSSVEETANGTKTTVSELSKTVAQNGKDITSVTARTKVVEDDLSGTKTTLSQVKTTADSTSQKTATLETGLNGLSAKFASLSVGNKNYLPASRVVNRGCSNFSYSDTSKIWTMTVPASSTTFGNGITFNTSGLNILLNGGETLFFGLMIKPNKACSFNYDVNNALSGTTSNDNDDTSKRACSPSNKSIPANVWTRVWFSYTAKANVPITEYNSNFGIVNNTEPVAVEIKEVVVAKSNVPVDYQTPDAELEQKVAEYKQNADQNYASLQTTVQNLDGTVQQNKATADQTAEGFKTRIKSLETYKDGETTRASQYFESAKTETARQLTAERTAIAKDYVAKSTYTSDVTGIRNDLTATTTTANTTKTNLANYQASNDKAVANLQSNLQTANGNISSLKTKVEAVPGQITSAVSAVEGKIPTSAGGRNLALGTSADWSAGLTSFNGQNNQTIIIYRMYNRGFKIGDRINIRLVLKYSDIVAADGQTAGILTQFKGNVTEWGMGQLDGGGRFWFDESDGEIEIKSTTVVDEYILKNEYWEWRLRVDYVASGKIQWKEAKAEVGDLPTPWSPAPEDTASQISNLSSQIQQTADGMTLLATKTELNTAKNELQSGITTATNKANSAQSTANSNAQTINTHTTQISALNTGLQAKVSQTEFNTLSGRVTTAENNITAKANELSSKITSVEGKIPTSSGGRNLAQGTSKDWSNPFKWFSGIENTVIGLYQVLTDGLSVGDTLKTRIVFKYDNIVPASGQVATCHLQGNGNVTGWGAGSYIGSPRKTLSGSGELVFEHEFIIEAAHLNNSYWDLKLRTDYIASGSIQWKLAKVERGMFFTDWSPAPEDTASQISNLSSQIQQTADGMTLLATKTELNTAKNELQSGITTATNKANSAQSTANSNAQTINTHTTQISALNTGLQAKVSQTEFNTLSGRVTTAENNITAKANELSSKITSVEGKIPTSSGGRNLAQGTSKDWSNPFKWFSGIENTVIGLYQVLTDGLSVGDTLKTRIVFKYDNIVPASGQVATCHLQGNGNVTGWGAGSYIGSPRKTLSGSGELVFEHEFIIEAAHLNNSYWDLKLRTDYIASGSIQWKLAKVERGMFFTDWSPAPEDYDSKLATAQSEIKQTTDAITASVSSVQTAASNAQSTANTAVSKADAAQAGVNTLDSTTVKSASLTINTDGIVMKAGKSTTDVANAIGSYFAVNQNAINLFADKIKVKGDMIVDGAITADKFKAARITSLNGATTFDLDSGNITFKKNLATINQVNGNYKSEVSLSSIKASIPAGDWSSVSTIAMDSTSFNTSKRRAGMRVDMMPTYSTTLITGETISFAGETESLGTVANSVSVTTEAAHLDIINKDTKGPNGQWNYPMIMDCGINAAIRVPDIKVGGYTKSLKAILNDLCKKAGILWT